MNMSQKSCNICLKSKRKSSMKKCQHCEEYCICKKCANEKYYAYYEWVTVSHICDRCKKLLCRDCTVFCYTCANEGEDFEVLCIECANLDSDEAVLENIDCQYHEWLVCKKHPVKTCGECRSNKNYIKKNEI